VIAGMFDSQAGQRPPEFFKSCPPPWASTWTCILANAVRSASLHNPY